MQVSADATYAAHDQALKPLLGMLRETDNTSTIRTLILKALSDPHIFFGFDEIKREVSISNSTDTTVLNNTLDLFSYGTYLEYSSTPSNYVNLTDSQVSKLKLLSVVTLVRCACDEHKQSVPYAEIAAALGHNSSSTTTNADDDSSLLRAVEEVVVAGIYSGMLHGKLCQRTKTFVIGVGGPPCLSRDVKKNDDVKNMLDTLQNLQINVNSAMVSIENEKQILMVKRHAERDYWTSVQLLQMARHTTAAAKEHQNSSTTTAAAAWPTSSLSSRSQDAVMRSSVSGSGGSMMQQRQSKRSRGGAVASAFGGMGMGRF
jgi:hypothetical protein